MNGRNPAVRVDRRAVGSILAAVLLSASPSMAKTRVLLVATIHGLHAKSAGYGYDTLYATVARFSPERIGVEIRAEDMERGRDYLARNYPAEMIHYAKDGDVPAFGFDWLGDEIAGVVVPEDWWSARCPTKQVERAFDQDPLSKDPELAAIRAGENKILADATPVSLNDGRYDALNLRYYERLRVITRQTRFRALSDFYAERDRRLAANVVATVRAHAGDRIAILTGADHRAAILRSLQALPGSEITIEPVSDRSPARLPAPEAR